jgi:hypothetical protein
MGNPEANMTFTISVKLGGQLADAPSMVFDQSFERTIAAISGGSGTSDVECRDATSVFKRAPSRSAKSP